LNPEPASPESYRQSASGSYIAQAAGPGAQASVNVYQFPADLEVLVSQLSAKLLRRAPAVEELFEILDDPRQAPDAIFRSSAADAFAPSRIPYVTERDHIGNTQQSLLDALLRSAGGGLLVQSRAGLGKTREVVQVAQRLCVEDWLICVAKSEGDARMAAPSAFPDRLRNGSKILFVLDDLHQRVVPLPGEDKPYIDRLNDFLAFFEARLLPRQFYVLATARTEPHHAVQLAIDRAHPLWRRFEIFELPGLREGDLEALLVSLGAAHGFAIDHTAAAKLVASSDHTPRILIQNIRRAAKTGESGALAERWQPTQAGSWVDLLDLSRRLDRSVDTVYSALDLLRSAGLPARRFYIEFLGHGLSEHDVSKAVDGLINLGLLGFREGVLDTFAEEPLRDALGAGWVQRPDLRTHWSDVIACVMDPGAPEEWGSDLAFLIGQLMENQQWDDAENMAQALLRYPGLEPDAHYYLGIVHFKREKYADADRELTEAIQYGLDDEHVYVQRSHSRARLADHGGAVEDLTSAIGKGADDDLVYFNRGLELAHLKNYGAAEQDFTVLVTRGTTDAAVYANRAVARIALEKYQDAEADLTEAIRLGRNDMQVYANRAIVRSRLHKLGEAEEDFDAALQRGRPDALLYFKRGVNRVEQGNDRLAEEDFTKVIELGDGPYLTAAHVNRGNLRRNKLGEVALAEADYTEAIRRGYDNAQVFYSRGLARGAQEKHREAEADFTAAIAHGMDDSDTRVNRAIARFQSGDYPGAEDDLTQALAKGHHPGDAYYRRGFTRYVQGKFVDAEADFSEAIRLRQSPDTMLSSWRGLARFYQAHYAQAEEDFTAAILGGHSDSQVYYLRGLARARQNRDIDAAADLTTAISQGYDDPDAYYQRGLIRARAEQPVEAEADFSAAIDRGQNDPVTYYRRGAARLTLQAWPQAEEDLTRAIAGGQSDGDLYLRRGISRYNQANYGGAESDFAIAIEKGSNDAMKWFTAAQARVYGAEAALVGLAGADEEQDVEHPRTDAAGESGQHDKTRKSWWRRLRDQWFG
jgi:tetratricopeptide (TPR) repeat protein